MDCFGVQYCCQLDLERYCWGPPLLLQPGLADIHMTAALAVGLVVLDVVVVVAAAAVAAAVAAVAAAAFGS